MIYKKSYYPWVIASMSMFIVTISNGLINSGLTVFDESLLNEFGWKISELKLRDSITFLGTSVLVLGAGWLVDRIGFKLLLMFGMLLLSICYYSYSYVDSLSDIYLLHVGFTLVACSAGNLTAIVASANWVKKRKGLAIGMAIAGTSVGGILIPPMANYLNQNYGWRTSMQIEAIIPLVMFVLIFLFVRNKTKNSVEVENDPELMKGISFNKVIKSPIFYLIACSAACTYFAILALFSHIFLYMRSLNYEPQTSALAISTLALAALAGKILSGYLSDSVDTYKLFKAQMAMMLIGLLGISFLPIAIWLFLLVAGFCWGSLHTLYNYILITLFGLKDAGKINGAISLVEAIGGGLGIYLVGYIYDTFDGYSDAWLCVVVVMSIGVILSWSVKVSDRDQAQLVTNKR
jgi:predicted MFS family arabinose efflux permease